MTHHWIYGVIVNEGDGMIRRVHKNYLHSTGTKVEPETFKMGGTIKVNVDPETGEGYLG